MNKKAGLLYIHCILLLLASTFQSCSSINKIDTASKLGLAAGGALGVLIGKKAGNPAIGATIGIALGGTTGLYIENKLSRLKDTSEIKAVYVIDGNVYKAREAISKLNGINPDDIKDIRVLANDAAIAQFGNLGANGAIIITLKKS